MRLLLSGDLREPIRRFAPSLGRIDDSAQGFGGFTGALEVKSAAAGVRLDDDFFPGEPDRTDGAT
jgi:hypothetical protein